MKRIDNPFARAFQPGRDSGGVLFLTINAEIDCEAGAICWLAQNDGTAVLLLGSEYADFGLRISGFLRFDELAADPADPPEGSSIMWQSDGTGAGSDGDIMMKITAGGVTKTTTLVDFSAIP